jgi:hypothetical protein
MNIYGCIIREKQFSRVGILRLATTAAGAANCGAPPTSVASAYSSRENSKKIGKIFATRTPTIPSVRMNIIHFPRAVIHQRPLLRALRAPREKFPPAAKRSPDFCKINFGPTWLSAQSPGCAGFVAAENARIRMAVRRKA